MNKAIPLTSVAEALACVDSAVRLGEPRRACLASALGKVLAESIRAGVDQPAYDQSSIDGFAVASGAGVGRYSCCEEWLPGHAPAAAPPAEGTAARVYTGTPLPSGCALAMIEDCTVAGESVEIGTRPSLDLIRQRGGSIRSGHLLLRAGTRLGPGEIALLASVGNANPLTYPAPGILHLTTGREIVPAGGAAEPWQIRDSNGPLIRAQLAQAGFENLQHAHVDESPQALTMTVARAEPFDCLFVSGGSSVGRYDNTAAALESMGFETLFHRVNARPGKPLLFARRGHQFAFGIPGNPVAHFTVFHIFLLRALRSHCGLPPVAPIEAHLQADIPASPDPRETFWPASWSLSEGKVLVDPCPWVHSGDVAALARVNGLIHLTSGKGCRAGTSVSLIPCPPPY